MKMKCAVLALAVLAVAGAPASVASDSSWETFQFKKAGFSILMPDTPMESSETTKNPIYGSIVYETAAAGTDDGVYVVTYTEMPAMAVKATKAEDLLAGVVEGFAGGLGGTVRDEHTLNLGKHPGRACLVEMKDKELFCQARIYLVGRKMFFLMAMGPSEEAVTSEEANSFLDSFKLLP